MIAGMYKTVLTNLYAATVLMRANLEHVLNKVGLLLLFYLSVLLIIHHLLVVKIKMMVILLLSHSVNFYLLLLISQTCTMIIKQAMSQDSQNQATLHFTILLNKLSNMVLLLHFQLQNQL